MTAAEKLTGLTAEHYRFPLAHSTVLRKVLSDGRAHFAQSTVEMLADGLPDRIKPMAGRLTKILSLEQIIAVPLIVGDKTLGLLLVSGIGIGPGDIPAVTAFAHQAAIALENARLDQAEREASQQFRDLAGYLQTAREEERSDIAREKFTMSSDNCSAHSTWTFPGYRHVCPPTGRSW